MAAELLGGSDVADTLLISEKKTVHLLRVLCVRRTCVTTKSNQGPTWKNWDGGGGP